MAWVVGQVTQRELAALKQRYEEVNVLTEAQENTLWGGSRELVDGEDQEPMIIVWVDCDAMELLSGDKEVTGQTEWPRCECGRIARWWAKSEMRYKPCLRTPMCDDLKDMLRSENKNKQKKFIRITEENRQ